MPIAIGLDIGCMSGGFKSAASGGSFWGGALNGLATAAVSAGASFGIGAALGAGTGFLHGFAMAAAPALAGGLTGGLLSGQSFSDALWSGAKSGLMAGAVSGVAGGLNAITHDVNFFTGMRNIDLTEAEEYACGGVLDKIKELRSKGLTKIGEKYVGLFAGENVYESKALGEMYVENGQLIGASGGITLPGFGITVGKGVYNASFKFPWAMELLQHEYGHILEAKLVGNKAFYKIIAPESLASAGIVGFLGAFP